MLAKKAPTMLPSLMSATQISMECLTMANSLPRLEARVGPQTIIDAPVLEVSDGNWAYFGRNRKVF